MKLTGCRNVVSLEEEADSLALEIKRLASYLSTESFGSLMHDLNRRIYELIHSSDGDEKVAALVMISNRWATGFVL